MYIKKRKIFEAAEVEDQPTLDNSELRLKNYIKDIADYKTKKSQLENLIKNNKDNKDIKNDITRLIGNNKILALYLPVINIQKSLSDLQTKIDYDNNLLKERQADLQLANGLTDPDDRDDQIKKANERLKEVQDRTKSNGDKLAEIQKTLKKEEDAFKLKMERSKKDLQTKIGDLDKGKTLKVITSPADNSLPNPKDADTESKDFTR